MTTSLERHSPHLDLETIAALIDGRLDAHTKASSQAHLAACPDCLEIFTESSALASDAALQGEERQGNLRSWTSGGWLKWTTGLAAAAAILVAVWIGGRDPLGQAMQALARVSDTTRPTEARLSLAAAWRPPRPALRGRTSERLPLAVEEAVLEVRRATSDRSDARALHANAIADVTSSDLDGGLAGLELAARSFPDDAAIRGDFAAVLLERWRRDGSSFDAVQAMHHLEAAQRLGLDSAIVRFNLALAHEALGMRLEAIKSWDEYLTLDGNSEWAKEAREHLARLRKQAATGAPVRDLDDAGLRKLAETDPSVLYRFTESDWDSPKLARVAAALRLAGRDSALADALSSVSSTSQRDCLNKAFAALHKGRANYEAGAYQEAKQDALRGSEALRCAGVAQVGSEALSALVEMSLGRTPEALKFVASIERQSEGRNWFRSRAISEQIRGIAALQRTAFGEAVRAHEAGLAFARRAGDVDLTTASLAYLGTALDEQGDRLSAWRLFAEGFSLADRTHSFRRRYQPYARAATASSDAGYPGASKAFADGLLGVAENGGPAWTRVAALLQRSRAFGALGLRTEALADSTRAADVAVAVPDASFRAEIDSELMLTRGRLLSTTDPSAASTLFTNTINYHEGRGNRMRTASLLLLRGRAYLASGAVALAERDWVRAIELVEDQRPGIRNSQLRVSRLADIWDVFDELTDLQRARKLDALATVERGHARELLDALTHDSVTRRDAPISTAWIPSDTVVLVYAALPHRLLTWVLTRDSLELLEAEIKAPELRRHVSAHLEAIRRQTILGTDLGRLLVPDVVAGRSFAKLVVVPDGPLHEVPFASLIDGSGRFLIERTTITVSPALSVYRELVQRPNLGHHVRALLVSAPMARPDLGLPRLPAVERETDDLVRLYPRREVLTGTAATKTDFLRHLPAADVINFGGHALVDSVRPSRSRMLLSRTSLDDGSLYPADIAAVVVRPGALVVLGACETAAGLSYRGEGPQNIARSFLVAGAATVVASLWKVADEPSTSLLVDLHSKVSHGSEPASSLAEVQRARITRREPAANWAGFVAIGRN